MKKVDEKVSTAQMSAVAAVSVVPSRKRKGNSQQGISIRPVFVDNFFY